MTKQPRAISRRVAMLGAASAAASFASWPGEAPAAQSDFVAIDHPRALAAAGKRHVAFHAIDLGDGTRYSLNDGATRERNAPWSTFKMPNFLIALETGIAPTAEAKRRWDPVRRPAQGYWPADWKRDHTLASAFRASAVWYYRDVAAEVGTEQYRRYLQTFGYGNASVPDGSDDFWLVGPLAISAREQAEFLVSLLSDRLPVAETSVRALADASRSGEARGVVMHAKTGSGRGGHDLFDGWFTGWVARQKRSPLVFALYARAANYASIRHFRRSFSEQILTSIDVLPPNWGSKQS